MTTAGGVIDSLSRDTRQAVRGLRRSPLFTLVALLTLAIGIGATTAVFSVVDGVLLKPLPYPDPERLVAVWHDAPGAGGLADVASGLNLSPSMMVTYRDQGRSFEKIGLWGPVLATVTGLGEPEQLPGAIATGQLLPAFGVPPLLGRWIEDRDNAVDAPPVAVLGYGYWQRRFGGDRNVVGKSITVNGVVAQIVGVMPKGFRLGDVAVDLIRAYRYDQSKLVPPPFFGVGIARLKPGVSIEQANADMARLLPVWIDSFPFPGGVSGKEVYLDTWKIAPALRPLKADVIGTVGDTLWVVMAMIGLVLVIACANVANLLLVRGEQRRRELAVRAALGAGTWRIARGLLAESLLLALGGGLIGVAVAYGALQLLLWLAPPRLPRVDEIVLDGRALAFAFVVTLVAGSSFGLAPMLRAAGAQVATALRGGRGTSSGRAEHRTQNALVIGQVALALVLLVSSGLMIRTFLALRTVEPGFTQPETLQTFRIQIPALAVPDPVVAERQEHAILDAVAAIPGVKSAAFASGLPMANDGSDWDGIDIESRRRLEPRTAAARVPHDVAGFPRDDGHAARRRPRVRLARRRRHAARCARLGEPRAHAVGRRAGRPRPADPHVGRGRPLARGRRRCRGRAHERSRPGPADDRLLARIEQGLLPRRPGLSRPRDRRRAAHAAGRHRGARARARKRGVVGER